MKKVVRLLCIIFIVFLAGCSADPSEKLIGAWKSEKDDSIQRKPDIIILTKDSWSTFINKNDPSQGEPVLIEYEIIAGGKGVNIMRADHNVLALTVTNIENNSITLTGARHGKYMRITHQEAETIIKYKPEIKAKPDPGGI